MPRSDDIDVAFQPFCIVGRTGRWIIEHPSADFSGTTISLLVIRGPQACECVLNNGHGARSWPVGFRKIAA
jgi:hypothetical protein